MLAYVHLPLAHSGGNVANVFWTLGNCGQGHLDTARTLYLHQYITHKA